MARVRKATTCARIVLEANCANCSGVTDSHLDQIITLMVEGSARYSWYIDVLLSLARGLPDADSKSALNILNKILAPADGYLIVLYSGPAGRERRARELATLDDSTMAAGTGMVAFHHGVVQLLAELSSGLSNEVEMLVQSIVPLHEVCAHICDAFCPYAIRASFFFFLVESYTVTALKVQSLVQSPAVWQVLALFNSELRSVLECLANYGDEEDYLQARLKLRRSTKGPCFIEAGLWFCVSFLQKHAAIDTLQTDHRACLSLLQRVCARLLSIEKGRDRAARAARDGAKLPGQQARRPSEPNFTLSAHQRTLLSAVVSALQEKGIGMGVSMWGNAGKHMHLTPRGPVGGKDGRGMTYGKKTAAQAAPATSQSVKGQSVTELAKNKTITAKFRGAKKMKQGQRPVVDDQKAADAAQTVARLAIERTDSGLLVATRIQDAMEVARPQLGVWEGEEFNRAVLIFKTSLHRVQPIIDQLKATAVRDSGDLAAAAVAAQIQERCLRVLTALLRAEPALQAQLNDMGVTQVMVRALASPASDAILEAALDLGIALLDGGNAHVQHTIYREITSSGSNASLVNLAHMLNQQCHKFLTFFLEQKQVIWYSSILRPHLQQVAEVNAAMRDRSARWVNARRFGRRGSMAALYLAVEAHLAELPDVPPPLPAAPAPAPAPAPAVGGRRASAWGELAAAKAANDAEAAATEASDASGEAAESAAPAQQAPAGAGDSVIDPSLASKVLLFLECICEGHYADMQNYMRRQEGMRTQVNVIIDLVNNLLTLERTLSTLTISLTAQVYQTLTELVQGPCAGNQRFLIGTNLCDVAVRFMYGSYPDCETEDVVDLKVLCLKLLLAMVEGVQSDNIPRRIASALNYDRLMLQLDYAYDQSGVEFSDGHHMTTEVRSTRRCHSHTAQRTTARVWRAPPPPS